MGVVLRSLDPAFPDDVVQYDGDSRPQAPFYSPSLRGDSLIVDFLPSNGTKANDATNATLGLAIDAIVRSPSVLVDGVCQRQLASGQVFQGRCHVEDDVQACLCSGSYPYGLSHDVHGLLAWE